MLKTALNNIRRTPYQAFVTIMVTSLIFFIISVLSLVSVGAHLILADFETRPQIIAYLKDSHSQESVNQLLNQLSTTPEVKTASYVSKEEALKIYKEGVGNDPLLLGTVTDWGIVTAEILPASVEVTARSSKSYDKIVSILKSSDLVNATAKGEKEIDFPQDIVSELNSWTNAIRMSGIVLIFALSITLILTVMTTISMKISSKKYEISTLRLLGAKNAFILKPYVIESLIYGLSGALIGWTFSFIALLYTTPFLVKRLSGIIQFPIPLTVPLILLGGLLIFSILLNLISSFLSSIRFIKRK